MIGDIQDICCDKCGKYLFTEKHVKNENRPESLCGIIIRENDNEDYEYDGKADVFICNECLSK